MCQMKLESCNCLLKSSHRIYDIKTPLCTYKSHLQAYHRSPALIMDAEGFFRLLLCDFVSHSCCLPILNIKACFSLSGKGNNPGVTAEKIMSLYYPLNTWNMEFPTVGITDLKKTLINKINIVNNYLAKCPSCPQFIRNKQKKNGQKKK